MSRTLRPETTDVLARIVETKRREVESLRGEAESLRARAVEAPPTRGLEAALRAGETVQLLAEVKRRSPSAGPIRPGADVAEIALAYEAGGAAAISVLTDAEYFGGSLDALREARAAVGIPLLRKDFILDPVQVWEARAAGADGVLLIVRILEDARLAELAGVAREVGLDVLVEVHDADEMERALACGATLVGVNNRDLRSFRTELTLSLALAPDVPPEVTLVAESGIRTMQDVARLGAAGVDAVLVGESLMRQPDVRVAAAALVGQPRLRRGR